MNYCLYRKIGDQSTVCTAYDVGSICILFHKHDKPQALAVHASAFGRAPETFMFNVFQSISYQRKYAVFPILCALREAETENYSTVHNN